jgi:molecular chaperone GrpE
MTAERDRHPPADWAEKVTAPEDDAAESGEIKEQQEESEAGKSGGFRVNDKRHWVEGVDEVEAEEARKRLEKPAYVHALEEELKQKDETLREYIAQYKAAKTRMNEAISRIEREKGREVNFRIAELAKAFLSVYDDLATATGAAEKKDDIEGIRKGLELISQRIQRSLTEIGIKPIDSMGKQHDPTIHDAVAVQEVDDPEKDGIIFEELKKGYMLGDVLVRPASVVVGKAKK